MFTAPFDVIFSPFDVVEPDLLYMSNETAARILTSRDVRGTPDLVVEINSPGTRKRDATIKHHLYEHFGVVEYWIVDPGRDIVRVYRRGEGRFDDGRELARESGEVLTTPLLPGFTLPLTRLLRD